MPNKNNGSKNIKDFYKKVLLLQEEEKKKISRDLHDETGQIVISLGSFLNIIEQEILSGNTKEALHQIKENRRLVQDVANKMKAMAFSLRPPALEILGLSATLREFFAQFTKANPIKIEFKENMKDIKIDEEVEIALYRIAQEAIYNVLKHSNAKSVKVNLLLSKDAIQLNIIDDGQGFDMEKYSKSKIVTKMGLRSITERVNLLDGVITIESSIGKGTKIYIDIPL